MKLIEFDDADQKFITDNVKRLRKIFALKVNTTFHHRFINQGYCQDFAVIMFMVFSKYKPKIYIGVTKNAWDGGHAFVKIREKYYDAMFPSGTDSLARIAKNEGVKMTEISLVKNISQLNNWNLDKKLVNSVIAAFKTENPNKKA